MGIASLFPIFIFGAVFVGILALGYFQTKKAGENLTNLATSLGLTLSTTGSLFKKHSLAGIIRGKTTEVFTYTTGAGKSKQTWSAVGVTVNKVGGLTFTLKRRVPLFDFFSRLMGKDEAKTGDAVFDKSWVLKTNQPHILQAILLPELRQKIMNFIGNGANTPSFKLETFRVVYAERGAFSSTKVCARIAQAVEVTCDLVDAVEVGMALNDRAG